VGNSEFDTLWKDSKRRKRKQRKTKKQKEKRNAHLELKGIESRTRQDEASDSTCKSVCRFGLIVPATGSVCRQCQLHHALWGLLIASAPTWAYQPHLVRSGFRPETGDKVSDASPGAQA
jgi:hypothetical protein